MVKLNFFKKTSKLIFEKIQILYKSCRGSDRRKINLAMAAALRKRSADEFKIPAGARPTIAPADGLEIEAGEIVELEHDIPIVVASTMAPAAPASEFRIRIKRMSGQIFTTYVFPGDTLAQIKQRIQDREGIPPGQQRLIFGGKQMEDDQPVELFGLQEQSLVHLIQSSVGFVAAPVAVVDPPAEPDQPDLPAQDYALGFLAHVKNLNGKTITILINPGDTIAHIKEHIQDAAQVPPGLQRLVYKNTDIGNDDSVLASDLRLYDECTLYLLLRI